MEKYFARFVGKVQKDESLFDFEVWISGLPAILGRNESQNEGPGKGENICLGVHTTLSRQHAKVVWDPTNRSYSLECLSKNGCVVDGRQICLGERSLLRSGSAVRIGPCRLYFLTPVAIGVNKLGRASQYEPIVASAFDSMDPSNLGLSITQIVDWAIESDPQITEP